MLRKIILAAVFLFMAGLSNAQVSQYSSNPSANKRYNQCTLSGVYVSTSVTASCPYMVLIASGTPLTMTSTPTISTTSAVTGQFLIITSTASAITLQDNGTLTGSLLELGDTTRVISANKILLLLFDANNGKWAELAYGNN